MKEEKVFERRKVFTEDLKELTEVRLHDGQKEGRVGFGKDYKYIYNLWFQGTGAWGTSLPPPPSPASLYTHPPLWASARNCAGLITGTN